MSISCIVIQRRLGDSCCIRRFAMYTESSSGLEQCSRMRPEVIDRKLQDRLQLLQFEFAASNLRRVERSFVVVTQQVFVIAWKPDVAALSRCFGKTTLAPRARTIGATFALANPVESVAWCNNPCIRVAAVSGPCGSTRRPWDVPVGLRKNY